MSQDNRQRGFSAIALAGFFFFAWSIGAFGSPIVCTQPIRAAAFTYQQPIIGGYYMPAEALQQRAAAQLQMEASPDLAAFQQFQRFRQYENWAAQRESKDVNGALTSPPTEVPRTGVPVDPATWAQMRQPPPAAPSGAGPLPPPAPTEPSPWGAKYPTLMAKCSKCHSGADPDGGFILDGTGDLQSPHLAGKRDAIMREITNERMPRKPGTDQCEPLSPEEIGAVIAELWLE